MAPANGYSVPREALKVLQDGVLANPKIKKDLPADLAELSRHIRFEGSDKPSIPINWRLAESISALKGLEALMLNRLVTRKYDVEPADVVINT